MKPESEKPGVDLESLLSLDPEEGRISLGRERMVLISADAMGNLRRELWDALGPALASEVLFRFGNRCGREEADRLLPEMNLEDPVEALRMGPLLHAFEGVARVEGSQLEVDPDTGAVRGSGTWVGSYEAEQHLRLFGPADTPVCQTLAGYASGFSSAVLDQELLCRETACRGAGAPVCQWVLTVADTLHREELPQHLRSAYHALEARVRSSEALLETVRESTGEALYTLDEGGTITSWNRGAQQTFGYLADDVVGRHERLLFPQDLVKAGDTKRLRALLEKGNVEEDDVRRLRADGGVVRGHEVRRPIMDSTGSLLGTTVVLRRGEVDLEAERTLHALLDNVPDGIAVATMDQRIVEGNRAFRRMLGLPEEGPISPTSCYSLLANMGSPCADCPSSGVIHDSSTTQCHPSFVRPDGQRIYFDLRSFPLRNAQGEVTHELKYVRDVTREMERDLALEEHRRLATLGEMAARVAHEVKNPLAASSTSTGSTRRCGISCRSPDPPSCARR
ncbi:MAG: XylR N-terminal domain-containing protein [Planctomycetota bacterium]|jgi:PAS domain S-box-containing protein